MKKWSIRSLVRIIIVRFADVLSARSTKSNAIIHFIACTRGYEFEDKKKFYPIYYFWKNGGSQLWTSCFSELIRDPRSLFYRKGQSWLYKKQDSLPNPNQSFPKFQRGSIDGIKTPKWHLRKRMSVCSNLVISIFKSKLLVLFILRM